VVEGSRFVSVGRRADAMYEVTTAEEARAAVQDDVRAR